MFMYPYLCQLQGVVILNSHSTMDPIRMCTEAYRAASCSAQYQCSVSECFFADAVCRKAVWKLRRYRKWFVKSKLLDDTWILSMPDPDSNSRFVRWTLVNNYVRPLARERHSMAFIQNKVSLYGDADRRGQCINDVWKYIITSAQWSPIVTVGQGPEPSPNTLCYSTAAVLGSHMIIVIRCPHDEKAYCSPVGLQIWMFMHSLLGGPFYRTTRSMAENGVISCSTGGD